MKKITLITLLLTTLLIFSGCDILQTIEEKEEVKDYAINLEYDNLNNPWFYGGVLISAAKGECTDGIKIYPGGEEGGLIQYTYNGGGILSDPDGNIYHYNSDGSIFDSEGNPTYDSIDFLKGAASCSGEGSKPMMFAKDDPDQDLIDENDSSPSPSDGAPSANIVPNQHTVESWSPKASEISCYGNLHWKDFFPNAPNNRARARIEEFPITISFDFNNGNIEGDFCGSGKNKKDGFTEGKGSFCVQVKDSELLSDGFGGWEFDGIFDVDMDMSAAVLTWIDLEQIWVYNGQSTRMDVNFHGWLEPGNGSIYTDENLPATFQFLCDIYPPDEIF